MKSNSILAGVWICLGIGIVVAISVLWAYGNNLGSISNQASDWGDFGSVLGGAFTLFGAFATIGTLLFLYVQQLKNEQRQQAQDAENRLIQEKHDKVVEKQLAALTFEQYLNHRKLFIERLNEQSIFFNNAIEFPNPEKVYNAIFPKNRPNNCEYFVKIKNPEEAKAQDLTECKAIYKIIEELLENYHSKEITLELIEMIVRLQGCLGIKYVGPHREGDIYFFGYHTGINIYKINECLIILESVLNSILFYSGNDEIEQIQHKAQSGLIRDSIYRAVTGYHRAEHIFEIRYTIEALPYLHEIHEASQQTFFIRERAFEETYRALYQLFTEQSEILKLKDFEYADRLTDIIHYEIKSAKIKYKENKEAVELLERIDAIHWKAMEKLGVTR